MSPRTSWRREVVELLPYVRRLRDREIGRCEAYRPRSARARRDPELSERYRCNNAGRYRYRFLKSTSYASSDREDLCWQHLMSRGIYGWQEEQKRWERWWRRHLDEVNAVRAGHGLPPVSGEGQELPSASGEGDEGHES